MGFLSHKLVLCTVCKKSITHKHKPKREWDVEGPLCGDCYISQMQKYYDLSVRQKCITCGIEKAIPDLWEPKYQWNVKGLFCKTCFDQKDSEYAKSRTFCSTCGKKLGVIRYNPKRQWALSGQLCKECWNIQKAKMG